MFARRDRELWGIEGDGAKMGQTTRQSMPFNARYAFMQSAVARRSNQKPRSFALRSPAYSPTQSGCAGHDLLSVHLVPLTLMLM